MNKNNTALKRTDVASMYVSKEDRFVVSLIIGYGSEGHVKTADDALGAMWNLVSVDGATTQWSVHDRWTGETRLVNQIDMMKLAKDPSVKWVSGAGDASPSNTKNRGTP